MKLLFVCNNLHIGGIQKSLVNLLKEIADTHEVTLFLAGNTGALKAEVPASVRVIYADSRAKILGLSQAEAKKEGFFCGIWRAFWTIVTKIVGIRFPFWCLSHMQKIEGEYDVAISFMQNSAYKMFYGGCNELVINCARAEKKISFVHCDFEHYFGNNAYNRAYYEHFDRIACVSDSCKALFDRVCPNCAKKTYSVHNCYDFSAMQQKAREYEAEYTEGCLNLFTAARISEEKGIFRIDYVIHFNPLL